MNPDQYMIIQQRSKSLLISKSVFYVIISPYIFLLPNVFKSMNSLLSSTEVRTHSTRDKTPMKKKQPRTKRKYVSLIKDVIQQTK